MQDTFNKRPNLFCDIHQLMSTVNFQDVQQISFENRGAVEAYLKNANRLDVGENVTAVEVAGEGNMNVVLRVKTEQRSFILKQSRPFVQKYPSVAAPSHRVDVEAQFYELIKENEIWREHTPTINWFDEKNLILCMEDLGVSSDFTDIYKKDTDLSKAEIAELAKVISDLHSIPTQLPTVENLEMRKLNHQHIFRLPFMQDNGFDLDSVLPGLQEKTEKFRTNDRLKKCAQILGDIYLEENGSKLLHGDFYPGSWLRTSSGIKIIDPEFCFHGRPEFELGVAIAHLKLAQQTNSIMKDLFVYYHFDRQFDGSLFTKFAGIEMIRRLIGLAQLPLELNLQERLDMLDEAYNLVIHG